MLQLTVVQTSPPTSCQACCADTLHPPCQLNCSTPTVTRCLTSAWLVANSPLTKFECLQTLQPAVGHNPDNTSYTDNRTSKLYDFAVGVMGRVILRKWTQDVVGVSFTTKVQRRTFCRRSYPRSSATNPFIEYCINMDIDDRSREFLTPFPSLPCPCCTLQNCTYARCQ